MKALVVSLAGLVVLGVTLVSATQNPTPFVNQPLIPASVAPGGAGFTLTVNGTGFVSGSTLNWNGSPRTTTFVSSSQVTASIPGSDIAKAATVLVTVVSPAPGGGTSNVVFLPVREPSGFVSLNTTSFGVQLFASYMSVADLNKDGNQDMAVVLPGNNEETISILLGNGDGTFSQGAEYLIGGSYGLLIADVNGDGKPDLVIPNFRDLQNNTGLGVLLGHGDGTFQQSAVYPGNACCQAAVGDFNRDGAIDVAVIDGNVLCVFPGNGDGSFQPPICDNTLPGNFNNLAVGDFNADGKLDVALSGYANGSDGPVTILLGVGDGTFQVAQSFTVSGSVFSAATADFNGDGKLDLAFVGSNDNIWLSSARATGRSAPRPA